MTDGHQIDDLERRVAELEEQVRGHSEQLAAATDALREVSRRLGRNPGPQVVRLP